MTENEERRCPDGGRCHHNCGPEPSALADRCFRVQHASPLSGVYPGNRWPAELRADERPATPKLNIPPPVKVMRLEAGDQVYGLISDPCNDARVVVGARIKRAEFHGTEQLAACIELGNIDEVSNEALLYLIHMAEVVLTDRGVR